MYDVLLLFKSVFFHVPLVKRVAELDRKQVELKEGLEAVRHRADALKLLLLAMRDDGGPDD